jgi:O-antigen/teichoic acid export membrane protein
VTATSSHAVTATADPTQRIARAATIVLGRRIQLTVLAGVSTAVIARVLSPANYGSLQNSLAIWTLVVAFSDFGFTLALSRDLAIHHQDRPALLRTAFRVQGLWSLLLAAVCAGRSW